MKGGPSSERALVLAPRGRDGAIAVAMLREAGMAAEACPTLDALLAAVRGGVGFVVATEEALATADLQPLAAWIAAQEEWSDLPFVLLTLRGGGLERNPAASRYLDLLGNVTFLERPFHPTTLVSLGRAAVRARRRQYEARARLLALRDAAEGLALAQDAGGMGSWDWDVAARCGVVSPSYRRLHGLPPADAPLALGDLLRAIHPEDRDAFIAATTANAARGGEAQVAYRVVHPDGAVRHVHGVGRSVPGAADASARFVGIVRDVTAEKNARDAIEAANAQLTDRVNAAVAEREAVLAQLHEAQKMETLGQLTGGVAHDFNNLLTPITGALDMLGRRLGDDARARRLVEGAQKSAERARTLVQRLLGFARRQPLSTRPVDLAGLLAGMRDLVGSSVGPRVELRFSCPPGLPPALADPAQLELAVLNLCVNARDAMPDGGRLTLALERRLIGPADHPGLPPGAYLALSVIDTGTGMDAATLGRAVEPFFSTKELGRGTGLGLSMVHGLAGQLGGAFLLASRPGEGTRADMLLPAAQAEIEAVPPRRATEPAPRPSPRRLLLVDDEPLVRAGTAEMLRDLGHHVTEAGGGAEALALLAYVAAAEESPPAGFDAVVTDYMMPRMDGAELARRLADGHPGLPVLIVTGYAGGDLRVSLPQLAKPFLQADLAAAVEALFTDRSNVVALPRARGP